MTERYQPLLFLHIPKTAGTSFREAASEFWGEENVWLSYGLEQSETHPEVIRTVYNQQDYYALFQQLRLNQVAMYAGHFTHQVPSLIALFGLRQSCSFVREPLQQIYSHFHHFQQNRQFSGSFEAFYRDPQHINVQSLTLQHIPVEALGFIGLTEHYGHSLEQINQLYGLAIENQRKNVGTYHQSELPITDQQRAEIIALNDRDQALYQQVSHLFSQRIMYEASGQAFVQGRYEIFDGEIRGWGWWAKSDDAVELNILLNGQLIGQVRCCDFSPELMHLNPPRKGFVGFSFPYSPQEHETISCEVIQTSQALNSYHAF